VTAAIFEPFTLCIVLVLTFLLPALGVWDYRRLLRHVREGRSNARLRAYLWTIALQWALTLGFMAWWLLSDRGLAPLRLIPKVEGLQWLAVGAGVAAVILLLIQMVSTRA
jgi:heme exporter protein D